VAEGKQTDSLNELVDPTGDPGEKLWSRVRRLWGRVKEEGLVATLVREAGGAFVVRVIGAGVAFGAQVLLARWMGARSYGIFTFVWTWITVLVLFGRLGVDKALIRYVPGYRDDQRWEKLRGLLQFGGRLVGAVCVGLSVVGAAVVWWFRGGMPEGQLVTFWVAFLMLPLLGLMQTGKGALQAFKSAIRAYIPDLVVRHVAVVAVGGLLFLSVPGRLSAPQGMAAMLMAVLCCLVLTGWWLAQTAPAETWRADTVWDSKTWMSSMVPMMLIAGMHLLLKRTDLIMLGLLVGPEAAGTYGAAARVSELSYFGLQSANAIMAPLIAELYHSDRHSDLQQIVTWTARGSFGLYLIVAAALVGAGTYVLALFGDAFVAGYGALVLLLGGQFANTAAGSVGFLMMMTGHEKESAQILAVAVTINILLNYGLIPVYGLEGAGIATASTALLWNAWMGWYVWRTVGINATVFATRNE
jgi:O-antigen/teichoic acid export membrane protein